MKKESKIHKEKSKRLNKFNELIDKEKKQQVIFLIEKLEEDIHSIEFQAPVDVEGKIYFQNLGLGLFDYNQIIKKPMDLSTVKKKLKKGEYKKLMHVFRDLELIWRNCKEYNMEGSDIYNSALEMEKLTDRLVEEIFNKHSTTSIREKESRKSSESIEKDDLGKEEKENTKKVESTPVCNDDESTMDIEKAGVQSSPNQTEADQNSLDKKILNLNETGLAHIIKLLQINSSKSLIDLDNERWMIKTGLIEKVLLPKVKEILAKEEYLK